MNFITPSIIRLRFNGSTTEFNGSVGGQLTLSDHSRSSLSVDYNIIQKEQRMANGALRKYIVAKKKNFSCSWSMLPTISSMVADGNANASLMKKYFEAHLGSTLQLSLFHNRNSASNETYVETYNVFWDSFGYDIEKRYKDFDYWNVNAEFTEI